MGFGRRTTSVRVRSSESARRSSSLPLLLWDASALAKRYLTEIGTPTVHALFGLSPAAQAIGTVIGYAETFSTLLRSHNRGILSARTLAAAKALVRAEVV